jgi:hypothetical protein
MGKMCRLCRCEARGCSSILNRSERQRVCLCAVPDELVQSGRVTLRVDACVSGAECVSGSSVGVCQVNRVRACWARVKGQGRRVSAALSECSLKNQLYFFFVQL